MLNEQAGKPSRIKKLWLQEKETMREELESNRFFIDAHCLEIEEKEKKKPPKITLDTVVNGWTADSSPASHPNTATSDFFKEVRFFLPNYKLPPVIMQNNFNCSWIFQ